MIILNKINNSFYTFNADDYMKIRRDFRIKGNLIGAISKIPRNSNYSGLPAIYSTYECQLLVEKGFATIVEKNDLNLSNGDEYQQAVGEIQEKQNSLMKDRKLEQTRQYMDRIIEGKRKKQQSMGVPEAENTITPEDILRDEESKIPNLTLDNCLVQIPTGHPFPPHDYNVKTDMELDDFKYRVFREFWEKGNYITEGDSFGCDFLIYPGDPIYFHASYIVHVLNRERPPSIPTKLLVGQGRLSINVKKICLYAYIDQTTNEIVYQRMKWLGNLKKIEKI